ncbi:hypothetical protein JF50_03385 [Pseudoalteromonas luteoviolacea]|uniref:Phage shock protein A n=1 Tax=Pseudoalteromonas luteoviolacea TaxID=43657 RepID=A0A0C1MSK5_9GAMM|nr:PspA/IM30 family protein [Pseudoalteromonas luteoviolacea]KID57808.1 hypothetical protein JF50_03385 [Pseudoalteromonas luteoviolacea]
MALIDRIEDVIKSEFNTLLGKSTQPETYDDTSAGIGTASAVQALIAQLKAEIVTTRGQAFDCEQAIVQWYEQAQYALTKGREDLARAALQERYVCQHRLTEMHSHIEKLSQTIDKLESDYAILQARKPSRYQSQTLKEECLRARLKLKQALSTPAMQNLTIHISEWERKLAQTESEASLSVGGQSDKALRELNKLIKNEKVAAMLQSLKSKVIPESANNRPSI